MDCLIQNINYRTLLIISEIYPAVINLYSETCFCGAQDALSYKNRITKSGVPVSWYRAIQDVPEGHSFFLANEFFDALPVHQFQVRPP